MNEPRDSVWKVTVPELGKEFFVINNIDKASGLINLSYSGDPEKYVDCGRIISHVKNLRGDRTYDFPGARAHEDYEILNGSGLFSVDRNMSLDGRVNLIFEEIGPGQTKVTANTRYVLQRQLTVRQAGGNAPQAALQTISFNFGSSASFANGNGEATTCMATGELEREVLAAIR